VAVGQAALLGVAAAAAAAKQALQRSGSLSSALAAEEVDAAARRRLPSRLAVDLDGCAGLSRPLLRSQAQAAFSTVAGAAAVVAPNAAALAPRRLRAMLARGAGTAAYSPANEEEEKEAEAEEEEDAVRAGAARAVAAALGRAVPPNEDPPLGLPTSPPRSPLLSGGPVITTQKMAVSVVRGKRVQEGAGIAVSLPVAVFVAPHEVKEKEGAVAVSAENPRRRRERAK
jgi:hypothetical protein